MQNRVLVVEDESDIRSMITSYLQAHNCKTVDLPSGENFLETVQSFKPHVILMDQRMPGLTGFELLQKLRSQKQGRVTPVLFLTGIDGENEKVQAFDLGADDYLTKPFSLRELLARTQALVRRSRVHGDDSETSETLSIENLRIDLRSYQVYLNENPIHLTLTEYRILTELLRTPGKVLSRDLLRSDVLENVNVTDRTIDVHMASVRKKIGALGDKIETIRGVGYRFASAN